MRQTLHRAHVFVPSSFRSEALRAAARELSEFGPPTAKSALSLDLLLQIRE
jgi:hypothetical protein